MLKRQQHPSQSEALPCRAFKSLRLGAFAPLTLIFKAPVVPSTRLLKLS